MVAFDEVIILLFDLSLHNATGRRKRILARGFKSEPRVGTRTRIGGVVTLGSLLLGLLSLLLGSLFLSQQAGNFLSMVVVFLFCREAFEEREREEEKGGEGREEEEEENGIVHLYLCVALK